MGLHACDALHSGKAIGQDAQLRVQGIRRVEAVTGQRAEAAIAQSEALSASVEHADTLQGAELEDKVKDLKKARSRLLQNLGYQAAVLARCGSCACARGAKVFAVNRVALDVSRPALQDSGDESVAGCYPLTPP